MKRFLTAVAVLVFTLGCYGQSTPVAPTPAKPKVTQAKKAVLKDTLKDDTGKDAAKPVNFVPKQCPPNQCSGNIPKCDSGYVLCSKDCTFVCESDCINNPTPGCSGGL